MERDEIDGYDDDWAGWCSGCGQPVREGVLTPGTLMGWIGSWKRGPDYWGSICCGARLLQQAPCEG